MFYFRSLVITLYFTILIRNSKVCFNSRINSVIKWNSSFQAKKKKVPFIF